MKQKKGVGDCASKAYQLLNAQPQTGTPAGFTYNGYKVNTHLAHKSLGWGAFDIPKLFFLIYSVRETNFIKHRFKILTLRE